MLNAGGLIKLHYHWNYDVLELFSEENEILYYRDESLFKNLEISQEEHNHLTKNEDGLFVDGTFVDRFSYDEEHDELYFDERIISREYTNQQITDMVNSLWVNNPFTEIGKINLTHWFELVNETDTMIIYKNNSDLTMTVSIYNPNVDQLSITIDGETVETERLNDTRQLPPGKTIRIISRNNTPLNLTITLQ